MTLSWMEMKCDLKLEPLKSLLQLGMKTKNIILSSLIVLMFHIFSFFSCFLYVMTLPKLCTVISNNTVAICFYMMIFFLQILDICSFLRQIIIIDTLFTNYSKNPLLFGGHIISTRSSFNRGILDAKSC